MDWTMDWYNYGLSFSSFSYGSKPGLGLGAVLGLGTITGEPAVDGRPPRQLSITKCLNFKHLVILSCLGGPAA